MSLNYKSSSKVGAYNFVKFTKIAYNNKELLS